MQHLQTSESDGGSGVTGQICLDPTGAPAPADLPSVAQAEVAASLREIAAALVSLSARLDLIESCASFVAIQRSAQ